jgi:hypothetical protein
MKRLASILGVLDAFCGPVMAQQAAGDLFRC